MDRISHSPVVDYTPVESKQIISNILSVLDEHKDDLSNGDYINICKYLKRLYLGRCPVIDEFLQVELVNQMNDLIDEMVIDHLFDDD